MSETLDFKVVGLKMNVEKFTTNIKVCKDTAKLIKSHESYKYLELTKDPQGRTTEETKKKIWEAIIAGCEKVWMTKLSAKICLKQ